ncbi:hypothetical protein LINPERPRIM_LOCUS18089 [Linum perenne]
MPFTRTFRHFHQNHALNLARDLNRLNIRLLNLGLGHSNSQHTVLHRRLNLLHLRILRQPKPPHELPAAPLHPVPRIVLVLLLHVPLPAYLQHPILLHLHFNLLLLQPRHVRLEHVRLGCLLPVDPRVHESRVLPAGDEGRGRRGEV